MSPATDRAGSASPGRRFVLVLVLALVASVALAACGGPSFCSEHPTDHATSVSQGAPWAGALLGGVAFVDAADARLLPSRHRGRCVNWATARLVHALHRAGRAVAAGAPGSPPLGVGNLSRARGGPIPYSHSHQAGRDADVAFYELDARGAPVAAEDLVSFGPDLRALRDPRRRFDVARNWALVRALVSDPGVEIRWLFVSEPLRARLLAHARAQAAPGDVVAAADRVLHQPAGAPPHDDHLHVRLRCTAAERARGCVDG